MNEINIEKTNKLLESPDLLIKKLVSPESGSKKSKPEAFQDKKVKFVRLTVPKPKITARKKDPISD